MYYQVEKMNGYYRIGSPENVFCYLIEGADTAMLIDTGYCYGNLRETVKTVTDKPLVIVNTFFRAGKEPKSMCAGRYVFGRDVSAGICSGRYKC